MENERNWTPAVNADGKPSSRIKAIDYDVASRTLYVKFPPNKSGDLAIYGYGNVKPSIFAAFKDAPSKGKFFETIKNNKEEYPYQRIGTEREEEKQGE